MTPDATSQSLVSNISILDKFYSYSLDECENIGKEHAVFGWSPQPLRGWTDKQREAYHRGYSEYFNLKGCIVDE